MLGTQQHFVIIVAGGTGKRMHSPLPKQFIKIHGKPIVFHTIEKFLEADSSVHFVISLHPDYVEYWQELINEYNFNFNHKVVKGGSSTSNKNKVSKDEDLVESPVKKETPVSVGREVHAVSKGDTQYSISKKYNLTVKELQNLNGLSNTNLSIGQVLVVKPSSKN